MAAAGGVFSKLFVLFSLVGVCVECAGSKSLSALMTGPWEYQIVEGLHPGATVTATFNNSIQETGYRPLMLEMRTPQV